jgi:hypothetical protein
MKVDPRTVSGGGMASGPPPRTSTPEGFRNLRVLIPEDLHWRLRNLAHQSRMSFHRFIVAWLTEAFPLNPAPETRGTEEVPETDPGRAGNLGLGPSRTNPLNPTVPPEEQRQGLARPEHGSHLSGTGIGQEPVAPAGVNPHA